VTRSFEGSGTPVVRIERDGVTVAGRMGADVAITVPDARLWSADEPNRYVCHVILRADDGAPLDEVRVVEETSRGWFVKHKGVSGWYFGELL
jgi:hypothetical protein